MNLPKIISEYFNFKNAHDKAGLLSVFNDESVVIDRGEEKEMHGMEEIETWIDKSLSRINLHSEISTVSEDDGIWIVETIVTGDFKASPAKFTNRIRLNQEKFYSLDIEFGGSLGQS